MNKIVSLLCFTSNDNGNNNNNNNNNNNEINIKQFKLLKKQITRTILFAKYKFVITQPQKCITGITQKKTRNFYKH